MEREQETQSSSALYEGERGVGGKVRKPQERKPTATPYDRPTANQLAQRRDGGWLSKLVDPAYRLIAGGATKIFPSFFSGSPSTAALPPSNTADHDKWGTKVTPNANDDDKCTSNFGISRSTGGAGPSKVADRLKNNSECDVLGQDKKENLRDDSDFLRIEQLMKGKRFSRDEINHLTEILNSSVVDLLDVEREQKKPSTTTGGDAEGALLARENFKTLIEVKQEDMNRAVLGSSMPLLQSNMQDEVGASPVDVARAYMGSRTSEIGPGFYSILSKDERALKPSDEFASKPFIPSPSPKSSACWPGAMVQDQRGCITPQSQRGSYGLRNFPRTPYSRTIHSKSNAKLTQLQADSSWLNVSSSPVQQTRTPIYGQVKSRSDVLDDGYGLVGPIRRIRHKFASEARPRGSVSLYSSQNAPSPVEKSSVFKGFLPAVEKNLELGGTSGTSKYQTVDRVAHSSEVSISTISSPGQAVRKILEHLDRNKPTPKEMAAELKLATAWKKPPSELTDVMPRENSSLPHLEGFDSFKNADLANQIFPAERNDDRGNSNFKVKPQERSTNEAFTDAVNACAKASSSVIGDAGLILNANAGPSLDLQNSCDSQTKSSHEKAFVGSDSRQKGANKLWPFHNQVNGSDLMKMAPNAAGSELPKKPPSHSSGSKPILTSISINKPDPRRTVSSDNGLGFTFPVSASSGVLTEPPTPSVMPSFAADVLPQLKDGPAVPSYSFGTKKSNSRLVFSFPSTSGASTHADPSDLTFNFGSAQKTRVSFSSVGKDAICF